MRKIFNFSSVNKVSFSLISASDLKILKTMTERKRKTFRANIMTKVNWGSCKNVPNRVFTRLNVGDKFKTDHVQRPITKVHSNHPVLRPARNNK